MTHRPRRLAAISLGLLLASLAAAPAFAQSSAREREAEEKAEAQADAAQHEAERAEAAKAPPPAIPGAAADSRNVIPADKAVADMSPNDALFDAIARGDLNSARDAMNRGAQLDARNVLGQTPLDASIDLNRNDITFLLLSLRGAVGVSDRPPPSQASAAKPAAPAKTARLAGKPAHKPASPAAAQAVASASRGTPNPDAGFLGF